MAEGFDRVDSTSNGYAGTFVIGLLTGATLGAGLGLLFAPKAGSQLRRQIGERASNVANTTSETYRKASDKAMSGWRAARIFYGKAREATGTHG